MEISHWSITRFLTRFKERQSLKNPTKPGRPSLGTTIDLTNFIDAKMEGNDELTSQELTTWIHARFGIQIFTAKNQMFQKKAQVGANGHQILSADLRTQQRLKIEVQCDVPACKRTVWWRDIQRRVFRSTRKTKASSAFIENGNNRN